MDNKMAAIQPRKPSPIKLDMPARWLRQEYKSNTDKFEKPFTIQLARDISSCKHDVTLEQSYNALGTTVWDGSIALAKTFENSTRFPATYLKQCRVLELGAGCGLVGIALCLFGAKSVTLTDMELCLPTIRRNIDRNIPNSAKSTISVSPFTWGHNTSELTKNGRYDMVVASEVLYEKDDSKLLAQSAAKLLHEENGVMFVSMGRNRKGEAAFVNTMANHGYITKQVAKEELHTKYQDDIIKVIALSKATKDC